MSCDVQQIKQAAAGRWPEIISRLGGVDEQSLDGRHHPCPKCGGTDRFRYFTDGTGGAICNRCFRDGNGDGIGTLMWILRCDFKTAIGEIATYLGIEPSQNGQAADGVVAAVARDKRMPIEAFKRFGAKPAMRGKLPVARVPVYNEIGEQHSYFDSAPGGGKGWFKHGKGSAGLFFPGRLPQPGERWLLTEGVKDAAALVGLGFLAAGLPGKELSAKFARLFRGADVTLVADRDVAGEGGAQKSAARLHGVVTSVRIATLPGEIKPAGGDDVRDVLAKPDGERLVRQAIDDAAEWQPSEAKESKASGDKLNLLEPEGRTEAANAQRLVNLHSDNIRWCDPWRKWLTWDGRQWAIDQRRTLDLFAGDVARNLWRDVAKAGEKDAAKALMTELTRFARASSQASGIANMISLARSVSGVPVLPDVFDIDPMLLNVVNGTIDLTTGDLRPHRRENYLTKLAPVEYDPKATAPRWHCFLGEVFDRNDELIEFVKLAVGYSLTGMTNERCLFFLHGNKGTNGKSTLVSTLQTLLGDYAATITSDMLMLSRGQVHPTEICDLAGTRLGVASETEDGRRLAESLIKTLTGGEDRMKGRRMREDFWEFQPSHKLWLFGNHKPAIRGTDDAIWNRIRLVPFNVQFQNPDKRLARKLEAELPGILAWAVEGCLEWQDGGLTMPEEVQAATHKYRIEQDVIGTFLGQCCVLDPNISCGATQLYKAYKGWCEDSGERPITQTRFGSQLTERGLGRRPTREGIERLGVVLISGV